MLSSVDSFASDVTFDLEEPLYISHVLNYEEKHKILSAEERIVRVYYKQEFLFSTRVPKNVFNPYQGSAANKLIELILEKRLDIKDKNVIDLGCGSGVIGLTCILSGASKVLFTDINPNVLPLQNHPLLRAVDIVRVQSLLSSEKEETYDTILMSTPTNVVSKGTIIPVDSDLVPV